MSISRSVSYWNRLSNLGELMSQTRGLLLGQGQFSRKGGICGPLEFKITSSLEISALSWLRISGQNQHPLQCTTGTHLALLPSHQVFGWSQFLGKLTAERLVDQMSLLTVAVDPKFVTDVCHLPSSPPTPDSPPLLLSPRLVQVASLVGWGRLSSHTGYL